jgi:hypothetical protein
MSQEINSSDPVSTAQTSKNKDQNNAKITNAEDKSTLTFEGQDETENSTNAQASFGDNDRENGEETIPHHCQHLAPPAPREQPKTLTPYGSEQESNPKGKKQTKNSRKMSMRHKADQEFIAKKVRSQSREVVKK